MIRTDWRTRVRAAFAFVDHLLCHADSVLSAWLDIRPIRNTLVDAAAWLGQTWRTHLDAARIRRHGPGRGVIAVVISRPKATTKETKTHG